MVGSQYPSNSQKIYIYVIILNIINVFNATAACVQAGGGGTFYPSPTQLTSVVPQAREWGFSQKINIRYHMSTLMIKRSLGFIWIQDKLVMQVVGKVLGLNGTAWSGNSRGYI